ncbi:DrmB family protein [Streptomyces sp. NPDC059506]|uniref:DUF1998 domain-containing protein n=1 Tax=Streptomyces TaxID=1883 RepID=UPI0022AA22CC|nr:DUF1998 domain-containing protein [Streptomyces sp. HB2AG]MCZ2523862.1 DUF1998 domain-containing protein [Streptomyces sp. HB2AG]
MTPMPARPRRNVPGRRPERALRRLGAVRRAQLITTYGVGSMIAVENESFIVAGLDSWDIRQAPEISEHRLARLLRVAGFRLPPAPDEKGRDGVRVHRFPLWYSCPSCQDLKPFRRFGSPPGKSICAKPECQENLVPSRFVMACSHGHLGDFPYWKWVHRKNTPDGQTGLCGGDLRLRTSGTTASLRSILVSCTCGVPEVSMEGAFSRKALSDLGIKCPGTKPWLKNAPEEACTEMPRTLQRGSSAAWNPVVRSALSIPPWGEGLHLKLANRIHRLVGCTDQEIAIYLKVEGVLEGTEYTVNDVVSIVRAAEAEDAETESVPKHRAYAALRHEEYQRLNAGRPEEYSAREQHFVCEEPAGDLGALPDAGIDRVMLVKRLREVRALESFTRVELPSEVDTKSHAPLALGDVPWRPAIEVIGEGVFLRLDETRLKEWESEPAHVERADRIRRNHEALLRERLAKPGDPVPASPVSPRYLLLHTLAHVLINEWSLDAGYPASALRERLYATDDMAGILIYTATSDSAGSLGGIVAQGEPGNLAGTLEAALDRAGWCSSDPLCMESEATGADSLNLAACHACVLLPETSCETNNSFLDRAMLVGNEEAGIRSFFDRG